MSPIQDHYLDKHAIANEEFKFECVNCGKLVTVTPGAPGTAKTRCKHCGHTIVYQVDSQKMPVNNKSQKPISVKLFPSEKCPGDYQVKGSLELNKCYCLLCPNPGCSRAITFTPKEIGPRKLRCKWCSTIIRYKVIDVPKCVSDAKTGNQHPSTDPVDKGISSKHSKAYIEWGPLINSHQVNLDKDVTIIGRDINKYPCDIETSGCDSCWRTGNDGEKYPCEIMIKDKHVSACSLEIKKEHTASGGVSYKATVRRAYNPVLIQQRIYSEKSSIYLNDGDIIKMGETTLTFKLRKDNK